MRYEAPETTEAAVTLLAGESGLARVLAGGTDLLVQLRSGMTEPDLVVDVKRIAEMRAIAEEEGGFRIGAAVSAAELGEHAGVKAAWPGVVEAAELIGSSQIQSRATLAGNLCNASPAADTVPALVAADAVARIAGPQGRRELPVAEVAVAPGKTALAAGELVESIFLPARPARASDAYLRFIPRTEMDIAVVGAGVSAWTLDAVGHLHRGTRLDLVRRRTDGSFWCKQAGQMHWSGPSLDDAALDAKAAEAVRAACRADRRQARHRRNTGHPHLRRAWLQAGPPRPPWRGQRAEGDRTMAKIHVTTTHQRRPKRRVPLPGRTRRCSDVTARPSWA